MSAVANVIDREHCMCGCPSSEEIADTVAVVLADHLRKYSEVVLSGRFIPVYMWVEGETA